MFVIICLLIVRVLAPARGRTRSTPVGGVVTAGGGTGGWTGWAVPGGGLRADGGRRFLYRLVVWCRHWLVDGTVACLPAFARLWCFVERTVDPN